MHKQRIALVLMVIALATLPACLTASLESLGEGRPPGFISGNIPDNYRGLSEPFSLEDQAARLAGERFYFVGELSCGACHGGSGRGDGPRSPYLDFGPADFAAPAMIRAFRQNQDYVFWWVSEGVAQSSMPQFKETMSETERWEVIVYAWSLGEQAAATALQPGTERRAQLYRSPSQPANRDARGK
ncbi:MAG: c-type cytochrome [Chloroflexi bacterium]|nr:c-type cytochrome [Chloroflexota bacterium]